MMFEPQYRRGVRELRALALRSIVAIGALVAAPLEMDAQVPVCQVPARPTRTWVPLCIDGNGQPALQRRVALPAGRMSVAEALQLIAQHAGVDLTMDVSLPALAPMVTLTGGERGVAEAMLGVVRGRPLAIDVTTGGALSVVAAVNGPPDPGTTGRVASPSDSSRRLATLPRVVVTATTEAERRFREQAVSGATTYGTRELAAAPGLFGNDVLRTARLLPGLGARNDYGTSLNVRGGESDQTLILLDGIPIYHPYHVGGMFGTFIDPAVGKLDMLTGVFPAEHNGRLSALLDVRSAEESRAGVHGTADISLLASSASLGGMSRSSSTTWLVAGRRTYADAAARLAGHRLPVHFSDANLHVTHRLPGGSRLSLTAYAGVDVAEPTDATDTAFVSAGNRAAGVSWSTLRTDVPAPLRFIGGDSVGFVQRAFITAFDANIDISQVDVDVQSHLADARLAGALTVYSPRGTQALGYELARQRLRYVVEFPLDRVDNFVTQGRSSDAMRSASGWYDGLWRPSPSLLIQTGARVDLVEGTGGPTFSPRLSTKLLLGPTLALTAAAGRHVQWLHSVLREDIPLRPVDFWVGSDSSTRPATAWVYSIGVERWLGPTRQLRVEGYHKQLRDLRRSDPLQDPLTDGDELTIERGTSSGVDVLLRQFERNGFSGWLSYGFGVSRRITATGLSYSPSQDRRHDLNVVGSWRSARWLLGSRLGVSTGTPYTEIEGEFQRVRYDPGDDRWRLDVSEGYRQYLSGAYNARRYPLAHRLDLSVSRIGLNGAARTVPYLSIANVYGRFNPAGYLHDFGASPPERVGLANFRFLPTFGVRHAF